jgi:hypothetical protein
MAEQKEQLNELQPVPTDKGKKKPAKKSGKHFDLVPFIKIASLVLMVLVGASAVAIFITAMVSPSTISDWLLNRQVGIYANDASSVSDSLMKVLLSKPFGAVYTNGYIRTIGLYVLVLALPIVCALLNIYFLTRNASSNKPFKKSTSEYISTAAYCFAAEFCLSSVLFIVLKLINRAIPYYVTYTMIAVAVLSAVLFLSLMAFRSLIDRMKTITAEAKKHREK